MHFIVLTPISFLLVYVKIPIALDMAKDFKGKEDAELFRKIDSDIHMRSAVIECYETLSDIINDLIEDEWEKRYIYIFVRLN